MQYDTDVFQLKGRAWYSLEPVMSQATDFIHKDFSKYVPTVAVAGGSGICVTTFRHFAT